MSHFARTQIVTDPNKRSSSQPVVYGTLDLSRHVFALAVIWIHTDSVSRYSEMTRLWRAGIADWLDGCVFGFFMLSGFFSIGHGNVAQIPGMRMGARRIVLRLALPYFCFSLLYTLILPIFTDFPISAGLYRTVRLIGMGGQLYFLPCLLVVSLLAMLIWRLSARSRRRIELPVLIGIAALLIAVGVAHPIPVSTGPMRSLFPLYFAAYLLGQSLALSRYCATAGRWGLMMALLAAPLALGFVDKRFLDFFAATALIVSALVLHDRGVLSGRRLPGAGGVYLLHTPIVNFGVATVLVYAGLTEEVNILVTVLLTYIACLGGTVAFIRWQPRLSGVLLE